MPEKVHQLPIILKEYFIAGKKVPITWVQEVSAKAGEMLQQHYLQAIMGSNNGQPQLGLKVFRDQFLKKIPTSEASVSRTRILYNGFLYIETCIYLCRYTNVDNINFINFRVY